MTVVRSRRLLIALTCVGLTAAYAATSTLNVQAQAARPGPAGTITEATLRAPLEFLVSDALNGRASNSRDEWIAAVSSFNLHTDYHQAGDEVTNSTFTPAWTAEGRPR